MAAKLAASIAIAITLLVVVPGALGDAAFIAKICKQAETHPECFDLISAVKGAVNVTTVEGLSSIVLEIFTATAREGAQISNDEHGKHADDDYFIAALDDCDKYYGDAIELLEKARTDFGNAAYQAAADKTGEAGHAGQLCEKAFSDRQLKSVMTDVNKRATDRGDLAWMFLDFLYVVPRSSRVRRLIKWRQ